MKRIHIHNNFQKSTKKPKYSELKSLYEISQRKVLNQLRSSYSEECVDFFYNLKDFYMYSNSFLCKFLISWIKKLSDAKFFIFYPSFFDWLKFLCISNLESEDINDFIKLLKTLLCSKIKDKYYEDPKAVFISIYCEIYHLNRNEELKYMIGKDICNLFENNDFGAFCYDEHLLKMFFDFLQTENIDRQIIALNYFIFVFKRYQSSKVIHSCVLNTVSKINKRLITDGTMENLLKKEILLLTRSAYFSEALLQHSEFRKKEFHWIKTNYEYFLSFKKVCNQSWNCKNMKTEKKILAISIVNCIMWCFKSISICELNNGFAKDLDEMMSLQTYLKFEFGAESNLMKQFVQILNNNQSHTLSHLTENISEYTMQFSTFRHSSCKVTKLVVLINKSKQDLNAQSIIEIYQFFLSVMANDLMEYKSIAIHAAILKLFMTDLTKKLEKLKANTEIKGLSDYICQCHHENVSLNRWEPWFETFHQLPKEFDTKDFSNSIDDKNLIDYLSMIQNICESVFSKAIELLKNENIITKKQYSGALCVLLESSNFIPSFLSLNHIHDVCETFFTFIHDIQKNKTENEVHKIIIKNYFVIFDRIFTNDICFYKSEKLFSDAIPKLIALIGEEFNTNNLQLRKYFIKKTDIQNFLLGTILKNKNYQFDHVKTYFENMRVWVKIGLKIFNDEQKVCVKHMVVTNLTNFAKKITLSMIPNCHFLFSLKYWMFDGFLIPSTQIFLIEFFKKTDLNAISDYNLAEYFQMFYHFFFSLLKFWNTIPLNNELYEIFENTIDTFIDFTKMYFHNNLIKNHILNMDFIDDKDYFKMWMLIKIIKKNENTVPENIYQKLHSIIIQTNSKECLSIFKCQLFYTMFEIKASLSSFNNEPMEKLLRADVIQNTNNASLIIQNYQFYKEKFIKYYQNKHKLNNCLIDKNDENLKINVLIVKLPSNFKLTFKVNLTKMAENSYYFDAALRFSNSNEISIDLSRDSSFYPSDKEDAVKLAIKIIVHLLQGSTLVKCHFLSSINNQKLLNSSLMICLFLADRLQMHTDPSIYLFDFIMFNMFVNSKNQYLQDELPYATTFIIKTGCIYLYQIILEIVINHLKAHHSNKNCLRIHKNVIITIVRNTYAHDQWYGSELCLKHLKKFFCK